MNVYVVTVKLPRNKDHDQRNKKIGSCQFSPYCTDVTGEHHSFIATAEDETQLRQQLKTTTGCQHVTRIERVAG